MATTDAPRLDPALCQRLYDAARAGRWTIAPDRFGAVLEAAAARLASGASASSAELERGLRALHLEDLALACACEDGHDDAWEHFVREHRPGLYRAAAAIDPSGGARDLADSIYADLFGVSDTGPARKSLFGYFHGRSSLGTWLRAVLAQRIVDRIRSTRRFDPLPDADDSPVLARSDPSPDPARRQYVALIRRHVAEAVASLAPRDRLRLGCYYAQDLTLAEIGRMLGEHEGTVSRHLTRTRHVLRAHVASALTAEGLDDAAVAACFQSVIEDAGPLRMTDLLGDVARGKEVEQDRSKEEGRGVR